MYSVLKLERDGGRRESRSAAAKGAVILAWRGSFAHFQHNLAELCWQVRGKILGLRSERSGMSPGRVGRPGDFLSLDRLGYVG